MAPGVQPVFNKCQMMATMLAHNPCRRQAPSLTGETDKGYVPLIQCISWKIKVLVESLLKVIHFCPWRPPT